MLLAIALLLVSMTAAPAATVSPNLLENGGFELILTAGSPAKGWIGTVPPGGASEVDPSVAHSGRASHRLFVPPTARVDWYSLTRRVTPVQRGATYTLSAWVRTQDVRDGAGAYLSLNFFDGAGKRIAFKDSPAKVTGTRDWQRLTTTAPIPDGTSEMRAVLSIHGRGTAWFDDVQVEQGSVATAYQPAEQDARQLALRAAEVRAAADWVRALPPRASGRARVAVLDLGPLGKEAGSDACPSDPAALLAALNGAGHAAFRLTPERLTNSAFLDPEHIDLLVIPTGDVFPAAAHTALVSYLSRGGAFLCTGGYAFDRPVVFHDGKWYDPDVLPIGDAPATPLCSAGTEGWESHTSRKETPTIRAITGPHGLPGVEIHTPDLQGWDTAMSPIIEGKLPAGWSVTRFWARGDANTPTLAVEWHETDGSRWKRTVALTPEWKEYTLFPGDFTYWHDNPSVGRGGPGDRFRPASARRMLFGVATDIARRGQAHTIGVAGIRVQADAAEELRGIAPRINTRWARIRDAMWPEPEQIGAFDPSFPLRAVATTRAAAGQPIVTDFTLKAPLTGYAATAMLGLNGHGFGPNRARWIPLLECLDAHGRSRGPAGAVVHHFSGTFTGSSWAIFGITNRDLFAADSPALRAVLLPTVSHLLRRLYLHETDTAYACYRPGETVMLRTRVSNHGRQPRQAEVRFSLTREEGQESKASLTRRVEVKPGGTVAVEIPWKPEAPAADFYRVAAELWEGGQRIDREETAVVIWNPTVIARGTPVRRDGTRFLLGDRPQFLVGCQTYWGQNGSVTARSPLAFDRDFRQMRDFGLTWTRCFVPFKTEEDKRISDAIVQLAQKHGILLYHTPNLHNTADPAELAAQQATAREIAERYRGVPGLLVDICNEPSFRAENEPLLKAFGKAGKPTGPWDDPEVAAFWRHTVGAQRQWAQTHREAIHAGDPARLASVGWSQGWGGGSVMKDPILASLDLDFTDRHYYGQPARMPAELRDVDLRALGKPLVLGECGAKNHPTFQAADPWGNGDDDESYDRRFLSLAHHALGLGAAGISSWHWRDPMEGIFPCGIVHQTGVARPTGLLYRALAFAFGRIKPASVTPSVYVVLPDALRQGGGREESIRAFHRATELLLSCRVDFGLIPDSALDRLPPTAKALLYPVPLNPSDAVVDRLTAFVEGGGALYLSGDLSYDGRWQPTRRDRLSRLCGVEAEGKPTAAPLALPPVAGVLAPANGSGLAPGEARPALRLKAAGAEALAACAGTPVITRYRRGKGQTWFCADPVELAREMADPHRALYRAFLQAAGTPGLAVTPDHPDLHVFRVPGEDADAFVLRNGGPAAEVTVGEYSLRLSEGGTGFLLVGRDGTLRAVEAQGTVKRAGKEVARITGHALLVATDDQDLSRSRRLMALPLAPGQIQWSTTQAPRLRAEVGEMRGGKWHTLAPLAAKAGAGTMTLPIAPAHQREMIRLSAQGGRP